MANRGRPRKITEEVDSNMNEEIDNITEEAAAEGVNTAIGEMSDSLQVVDDVRVLGVITNTEDIPTEEAAAETEEVEESFIEDEIEVTPVIEDNIFYALYYQDMREVGGGTFTFRLVTTVEEAEAWCAKGLENREYRSYHEFKVINIPLE
jgi:hypothetical protein